MLKSRRLTTLLSQSLSPLSPPIDTFLSNDTVKSADSGDASNAAIEEGTSLPGESLIDAPKSSLPHPNTPKIVMALLLTTNGNLLASTSSNTTHLTSYSLALSPSISQLSTSGGSFIGNVGSVNGTAAASPGVIVGSLGASSAIHMSDLSPKPRVYASYTSNIWRSYNKSVNAPGLFNDAVSDTSVEWIAVENEESTIVIHMVSGQILLALVGERGAPVGLLFARASAMASTLSSELHGFTFE